jgi:mannose-6-phosphate isomerase
MACARQLFIFSQAGDLTHAAALFTALCSHFRDAKRGGWYYSIGPDLEPLDTTKDLYTHAFVVFACSEYFLRSGSAEALAVLREATAIIEDRFKTGPRECVLNGALDRDFKRVLTPPIQNPVMHLAESYLSARAATDDGDFDEALRRIGKMVARTYLDVQTGCILEFPCGNNGNRIEPGHQFEWFYLVQSSAFDWAGEQLKASMSRAFEFAQRWGIDASTRGVCAALNLDGSVQDSTQRIWAQTEYLRALASKAGAGHVRELAEATGHFASRFLTGSGWIECMGQDGRQIRSDMPSTTPYHLCTAYSELQSIDFCIQ